MQTPPQGVKWGVGTAPAALANRFLTFQWMEGLNKENMACRTARVLPR